MRRKLGEVVPGDLAGVLPSTVGVPHPEVRPAADGDEDGPAEREPVLCYDGPKNVMGVIVAGSGPAFYYPVDAGWEGEPHESLIRRRKPRGAEPRDHAVLVGGGRGCGDPTSQDEHDGAEGGGT
jgi:hypothetical protein